MSAAATGALLIAASALVHALWNLKAKGSGPTASFMLAANTVGAGFLFLILLPTGALALPLPAAVWPLLALSAVFETIYYLGLGGAYLRGDLSAAYPVAKGLPVLVVATLSLFLFDRSFSTGIYLLGVIAIVLGIAAVAGLSRQKALGTPAARGFWNWVALAALGTAGYTLTDAAALGRMGDPGGVHPGLRTLTYLFWMCLATSALLAPVVLRQRRTAPRPESPLKWKDVVTVGVGMQVSYGLVLLAMAFLPNPGVVLALRQLSLPLTLVFSVWILGERAPALRWAGMALITAGVVAVKMA